MLRKDTDSWVQRRKKKLSLNNKIWVQEIERVVRNINYNYKKFSKL